MDFCRPASDEMISMLRLKRTDFVLDIAGGTGEPGLTIASIVADGKVIAADQAEGMLAVAREKAEKQHIGNYETRIAGVSELPFPDNTFDAVSCRFGLMFFPDMQEAVKEMRRVLKPGGRIAIAVWDKPENNFWVTAIMGIIMKNLPVTLPPPDAPGMFRCARPGFIGDLFRQAGFKHVEERRVPLKLNCGTAETYWNYLSEVGAAIVLALNKADEAMREKIKGEVIELIRETYGEGKVAIDATAIVAGGEK